MRRKPRRTRLWSSTSRTLIILGGMRLLHTERNGEADKSAATRSRKKFDLSIHKFGSFTHGYQTHPLILLHWRKSHTMVFHFKHHGSGLFLKSRQVDAEGALEAGVIEHHRMEGLRKGPDFIERRLHDIAHFFEVG